MEPFAVDGLVRLLTGWSDCTRTGWSSVSWTGSPFRMSTESTPKQTHSLPGHEYHYDRGDTVPATAPQPAPTWWRDARSVRSIQHPSLHPCDFEGSRAPSPRVHYDQGPRGGGCPQSHTQDKKIYTDTPHHQRDQEHLNRQEDSGHILQKVACVWLSQVWLGLAAIDPVVQAGHCSGILRYVVASEATRSSVCGVFSVNFARTPIDFLRC